MDFTENYLYGLVIKLAKDKVSNLRAICAVVLKKMIKVLKKKESIAECKATIEDLKKDRDSDVVAAANLEC
jgi:hypothetical protein